MATARRKRRRYTSADRSQVLAAAQREGLTAIQVQKRFGVTPVTYYSWRKKSGVTRRRRGGAVTIARGAGRLDAGRLDDLTSQVRSEVRMRVVEILPSIVRSEVSQYLNTLLAAGSRTGRRRRT